MKPIVIPQSNNPIVITDAANHFAFKCGTLNSVVNGRYLVVVDSNDANRVCEEFYGNQVDFIGTEEVQLDGNVRVIVKRDSGLFKGHQNRVEVD